MCGHTMNMLPESRYDLRYESFSGDRILVDKFLYQFVDPERWDVAVFKCPYESKTNFIKRIVGLPGEMVKISHGDLFTKPCDPSKEPGEDPEKGDGDFAIEQKPPDKVRAMLQPVFDNDLAAKIVERGWPPRWRAEPSPGNDPVATWKESKDHRSFDTTAEGSGEHWLRYRHRVPTAERWGELEQGQAPMPPAQLIVDGCPYNTDEIHVFGESEPRSRDTDAFGLHWVGDLALCCTLEVESESGEAILELVEGGWRMQCQVRGCQQPLL